MWHGVDGFCRSGMPEACLSPFLWEKKKRMWVSELISVNKACSGPHYSWSREGGLKSLLSQSQLAQDTRTFCVLLLNCAGQPSVMLDHRGDCWDITTYCLSGSDCLTGACVTHLAKYENGFVVTSSFFLCHPVLSTVGDNKHSFYRPRDQSNNLLITRPTATARKQRCLKTILMLYSCKIKPHNSVTWVTVM